MSREVASQFGSDTFNAWAARLSSLGYATFHFIEIATVGLDFLNEFLIPTVKLDFEPLAVDSCWT